jgi:hypothetical protein
MVNGFKGSQIYITLPKAISYCDQILYKSVRKKEFLSLLYDLGAESTIKTSCFFSILLSAHSRPRTLTEFRNHSFTDGRTSWMSDQLVTMPLPKHSTTQKQNKGIHTPKIHALSGIRIHDPSVRASEDSSCLILSDYYNRP